MSDDIKTLIDSLRALANAATPGPRTIEPRHHAQNQRINSVDTVLADGGRLIATLTITAWKQNGDARPDAAFFCACSPDVILRLLAALDRYQNAFDNAVMSLDAVAQHDWSDTREYAQRQAAMCRALAAEAKRGG